MAGPGVSAMYQYDFTLWGWAPGQFGCQVMGPWSAPYRGIWDPLYSVSLVLMWSRPVGRPAGLIWSGYRCRNTWRGNTLPPAWCLLCQSTTDYPACRCWTVKHSNSMATNCIWPYKSHAQLSTRQASPQCIWPIRAPGSQTCYPRNHQARQAIPEFSKGGTLNIRGGEREREGNQERQPEMGEC